jgi:hypothetical protein
MSRDGDHSRSPGPVAYNWLMGRHGASVVALLFGVVVACGSPATQLDADLRRVESTIASPDAPAMVQPVQRPACPQGWAPVAGKPVCEPWPTGPRPCAADEARFPGTTACQRLGTPCGVDDYAADLPATGSILFVNPAATATGTGTRQAPLQSLRTALSRATSGTIIALSRGTHLTNGPLRAGVTLWGACVAQTTLSSLTNVPAIAYADQPGVVVRNLRISGQGSGARSIGAGASLALRDVLIEGVDGVGWGAVEGGTTMGESVVVRDVRAVGSVSLAVASIVGGSLEATRLAVVGVTGRALHVTASATVRDAALLDTDVVMAGQTTEAVCAGVVVGRESTVQLSDVVVRDTIPTPGASTERGQGVLVLDGTLTGERLWLSNNVLAGLDAIGSMAQATLRDSLIEGTKRSTQSQAGVAVTLSLGAKAMVERVIAQDLATGGLDALGAGCELNVTDVVVSRTSERNEAGGYALFASTGARVTVTRARLEDCQSTAVVVAGTFDGRDVTVRGTRHSAAMEATGGNGIAVTASGTATLTRWLFENNQGTGVLVAGQLTGSDLTVRDPTPSRTESNASGVVCLLGSATLSKVRIERAVGVGVAGYQQGRLTLQNLVVTGTTPRACVGEGCPPSTVGVLSLGQASVRLSDFLVTNNGSFGLALDMGQLDAERGEVSDHLIGLNVRDQSYDVGRLDRDVRYLRNQTRLAAEVIPLPKLPETPTLPR